MEKHQPTLDYVEPVVSSQHFTVQTVVSSVASPFVHEQVLGLLCGANRLATKLMLDALYIAKPPSIACAVDPGLIPAIGIVCIGKLPIHMEELTLPVREKHINSSRGDLIVVPMRAPNRLLCPIGDPIRRLGLVPSDKMSQLERLVLGNGNSIVVVLDNLVQTLAVLGILRPTLDHFIVSPGSPIGFQASFVIAADVGEYFFFVERMIVDFDRFADRGRGDAFALDKVSATALGNQRVVGVRVKRVQH